LVDQSIVIDKLIRFVQQSLYHDSDKQPGSLKHDESLSLGYGRCGHAAVLIYVLFNAFNIPCRIIGLSGKHVANEFYYNGQWMFCDADFFKDDIIKYGGRYLSLEQIGDSFGYITEFRPSQAYFSVEDHGKSALQTYFETITGKKVIYKYHMRTGVLYRPYHYIRGRIKYWIKKII